jgi:dihydroorotate dehydrogenase (fumarate)
MDLRTTYLGLELASPLMPGASPLVDDLGLVKRLEDAGASAIVMHSLFEEQIALDRRSTLQHIEEPTESFAEALSYFPPTEQFALGPDEYLEQVRRVRETVDVPVIASLNGSTPSGWVQYALGMEQAGAAAIELNVYLVATDLDEPGSAIERQLVEVARAVKDTVRIPVAVKLSPFYSSVANVARALEHVGVDGLVLFNRFYQPEIDIDALDVRPVIRLSDPSELLLRVRWLAILSGRIRASLAASGGVHSATDAVRAVMAGAHAVQMVSALLRHGPEQLRIVRDELARWLEEHEYESLAQMRGSMSLERSPDPKAFERANYLKVLQSWHVEDAPRG